MLRIFFIAAFAIVVVSSLHLDEKPDDNISEASQTATYSNSVDQGWTEKSTGHESGAGLTSIAQTSAIQAKSAVQNQHTAASQAAYGAQNNLAQTASGAASTAHAALIGKQVLVQNLKNQLYEAQQSLQSEINFYHQTQQGAAVSQQTAHQAHQQVNTLIVALNVAQIALEHAKEAASQASISAANQGAMVHSAKSRLNYLIQQLQIAFADLQETHAAAQNAAEAAQTAQANANAAAAVVVSSGYSQHQAPSGGLEHNSLELHY